MPVEVVRRAVRAVEGVEVRPRGRAAVAEVARGAADRARVSRRKIGDGTRLGRRMQRK